MQLHAGLAAALAVWWIGCAVALADACPPPRPLTFRVEGEIKRDVLGFTQGLEVHAGRLFESTGALAGDTRLTSIDPGTGRVTVLGNFDRTFFGEGLTILREQIFQLSWREHQVSSTTSRAGCCARCAIRARAGVWPTTGKA